MPYPTDIGVIIDPPRVLDTPFVISDTKTVDASYTCKLTVTAPLLSSQSVRVGLWVTPPGGDATEADFIESESTQGAGLLSSLLGSSITLSVRTIIPPNSTVELRKTGAGSATYIKGQEAY